MFTICRKMRLPLALIAALASSGAALAQGKLEAHYTASLAGLVVGKGTWVVDIGEGHYTAAASGMTSGLVRAFTGGRASGAAQGTLSGGQSVASNYSATIKTGHRTDEIRLTVASGAVTDFKIEPPQEPEPDRVPVTDAHRRGVMDPMTASLLVVPGDIDLRAPQVCDRQLAVFDGRLRYNLKLAYKRIESVAAEKGYSGPAVVCAISFDPVAGFVPTRYTIKYLTKPHDLEVWLAPIAGTRVLVPFRAQIETPLGLGVVEATQFVSTAAPTRLTKGQRTP